ncbi:MAG: type III pantothenate kinase, partial [Ruminococcus sp.]|nr:type III pantothenate kinase [Ruminococcus sp.]
MLLAVDIGNTNIVFGCVNEENEVVLFERISTNHHATSAEYAVLIKNILEMNSFGLSDIDDAIMSSVVPSVTGTVTGAIKKLFNIDIMTVGPGVKTGLNILIDNPAQLGSDQVVDAVASINQYP